MIVNLGLFSFTPLLLATSHRMFITFLYLLHTIVVFTNQITYSCLIDKCWLKEEEKELYCRMSQPTVILATASYDHTIRFWEAKSGRCYRTIQYPDSVCLHSSPSFLSFFWWYFKICIICRFIRSNLITGIFQNTL